MLMCVAKELPRELNIYNENDRQVLIDEQNSDRIITQIKGSFIGKGNAQNTLVNLRTIIILHDNGDIETIVDRIDIKCNGGE